MPEVVVVGGGVMGASVAWHLAARGCRDVVVIDRAAAPGEGSTGRATGGFRTQFATPVNIRLSLLSREKLLRFPEEIGADSGYRPHGYLFLAGDETQMAALRSIRPLQQTSACPSRRSAWRMSGGSTRRYVSTGSPAAPSARSTGSSGL